MRRYLIAAVAALLVGVFVLPTTALAKQEKVANYRTSRED